MLYWTLLPLLLVAAGDLANQPVVSEAVDMIELNHFHDAQGRAVYDQVIFYEWSASRQVFHVRAWCLVEKDKPLAKQPVFSNASRLTTVRYYDAESKIERSVSSRIYRETWTQYDPERTNKRLLDESERMALYRPEAGQPSSDSPAAVQASTVPPPPVRPNVSVAMTDSQRPNP